MKKSPSLMKPRNILTAVFVVILFVSLGYRLWLSHPELQQTPDISLKIVDGRTLALHALRGRPVLVTFWATSCPTCVKEMPHLIELYQALAPDGLEIIGIAMAYDPPHYVMKMRRERSIPYPIALDINSEAALAFGDVKLTPTSFLIGPEGRIVYQKIGEMDMDAIKHRILAMLADTHRTQG